MQFYYVGFNDIETIYFLFKKILYILYRHRLKD